MTEGLSLRDDWIVTVSLVRPTPYWLTAPNSITDSITSTSGGVPINEAGNLHGNGYSDLNFIIPELVENLRVLEGPLDPRQGNYAVAGSADYQLGLPERGIHVRGSYGSFDSMRLVGLWGPSGESSRTFGGPEAESPPGGWTNGAFRLGAWGFDK